MAVSRPQPWSLIGLGPPPYGRATLGSGPLRRRGTLSV